jgi:hypothetical protein
MRHWMALLGSSDGGGRIYRNVRSHSPVNPVRRIFVETPASHFHLLNADSATINGMWKWWRGSTGYDMLLQHRSTVRSESRCALRLRYVHFVVSIEVAVAMCCCFTVFSC